MKKQTELTSKCSDADEMFDVAYGLQHNAFLFQAFQFEYSR